MHGLQDDAATLPLLERPVGAAAVASRSSFLALFKLHLADWIAVLVLSGVFYGLHLLHPFNSFVGKWMLDDLRYPMKQETVPFFVVPLISIVPPIVVFVGFYWFQKRDICDLHYALLGLSFALVFSGAVTAAIKDAAGLPRPDFFWRCFPDGNERYTELGEVLCTGDAAVIRDGHKSFPSGHASWCFSGLSYLSFYLAGKLEIFYRKGHAGKLVFPLVPLAVATYVSVTRVEDYKHHWEDIFVAAIIGSTIGLTSYLQHFPSPQDVNCKESFRLMAVREELDTIA